MQYWSNPLSNLKNCGCNILRPPLIYTAVLNLLLLLSFGSHSTLVQHSSTDAISKLSVPHRYSNVRTSKFYQVPLSGEHASRRYVYPDDGPYGQLPDI